MACTSSTYMDYEHTTCMYYDHSACMYYDHSTCMYYLGHAITRAPDVCLGFFVIRRMSMVLELVLFQMIVF